MKSEQKEETHKKEERKRKSKKTPVEAKPLIQKETDSVVVKRQMKEEDKAKIVMWLVIAILILFILGSIYMHSLVCWKYLVCKQTESQLAYRNNYKLKKTRKNLHRLRNSFKNPVLDGVSVDETAPSQPTQ